MTDDTLLPFSFPAIRGKKITAACDGRLEVLARLVAIMQDMRRPRTGGRVRGEIEARLQVVGVRR